MKSLRSASLLLLVLPIGEIQAEQILSPRKTVEAREKTLESREANLPKTWPQRTGFENLSQDKKDIVVDYAAVASRETAITNLKRVLKLKRGRADEPALIWRLSDMEWRATENYFRLKVSTGNSPRYEARHRELLYAVIEHTTELLTKFPKFKGNSEALVKRGRAYQELGKKDLALRDYYDYIAIYPRGEQVITVRLFAADLLFESQKFHDVLKILQPVDLTKDHQGLVWQVVERQGKAYFGLDQFAEALKKAEWLLAYHRKAPDKEKSIHYEDAILIVGTYYGTAFAKQVPGYSLDHALDYFRRLESGRIYGKLSETFILVLRTKDLQNEVVEWKNTVLAKAPNNFDSLATLVAAYDAILGWKNYPEYNKLESDFRVFFSKNPSFRSRAQSDEAFKKFKLNILKFSEAILATLPKANVNPSHYKEISGPYLTSLSSYMLITDPKDELKAKVRFKMGEFYVGMKDWDNAQKAFTEVYQAKLFIVKSLEFREQARTRAITARYDYFREKGVIPKELKAVALSHPKGKLAQDVTEWIKWVDEVAASPAGKNETMDQLLFEANRLVYAYSDVEAAYKRMLFYVGLRPQSKLTPSTCALIMDTLLASEAWVALRKLSIRFQQMPNVAVGEFKKKLESLERDSHYKITVNYFKNKDYPKSLVFGEEHLKLYPGTNHKLDVLAMMGRSAYELKQIDVAVKHLEQVIAMKPDHEVAGIVFAVRAESSEKQFKFKDAFETYLKILKLPEERRGFSNQELPSLKKKIFLLGSNSEDLDIERQLLESPDFCGRRNEGITASDCERMLAFSYSRGAAKDRMTAWQLIERGSKASRDVRGAWYIAAMTKGNQLPNSVLKQLSDDLLASFDSLDPISKTEGLAILNEVVPQVIRKKLDTIEELSQVDHRIDRLQGSLEKRTKEVLGLESVVGVLVKLPLPEARTRLLGILSAGYSKVKTEVDAVPVPKSFKAEEAQVLKSALAQAVQPIEEKVKALGMQSWELAKAFGLLTTYRDESADQVFGKDFVIADYSFDEHSFLVDQLSSDAKNHAWYQALNSKRAKTTSFFFQFSQSQQSDQIGLLPEDLVVMQWLSLESLGLGSDMASWIESKLQTYDEGLVSKGYSVLINRAIQSLNSERLFALVEKIKSESVKISQSNAQRAYKFGEEAYAAQAVRLETAKNSAKEERKRKEEAERVPTSNKNPNKKGTKP